MVATRRGAKSKIGALLLQVLVLQYMVGPLAIVHNVFKNTKGCVRTSGQEEEPTNESEE